MKRAIVPFERRNRFDNHRWQSQSQRATKHTPSHLITASVTNRNGSGSTRHHSLGAKEHRIAKIDLRVFGGSALTDDVAVPKQRAETEIAHGIPATYVPARNTVFLAYALAWAESDSGQ